MMAAPRHPSPIGSVAFEVDAKFVRGEAIRAIRGFAVHASRSRDSLPHRSPAPVSLYTIVRIMRDLELTLAAISGSLAESVGHATGSPSAPDDHGHCSSVPTDPTSSS